MVLSLENSQLQQTDLLLMREELKNRLFLKEMDGMKELVKNLEDQLVIEKDYELEIKFLVLKTLAKYYRSVKNYERSANYSRQVIRMSKNISLEYVKEIVGAYLDFSELEKEYGHHANARMELAKLLAFLDKNKYQDAYTSGLIQRSLGNIAVAEENMEMGLTQLEKALAHFQEAVPDTHPVIEQTIEELANAYISLENYNRSLELYQKQQDIYKHANNQAAEAKWMIKVGEVYFYINLKEARRTITEAIKLLKEVHNEQHLDIAKAELMLAEIDENMASYPRAITYYKRALEQLKHLYNENHFMIVYVYSKIGTISMKVNDLEAAKLYLEGGLKISSQFPKIRLQFLYALGKIYSGEKQYDQAFTMFHEFLQRQEKVGRKKSIAYGNTLQAIAFNYLEQAKIDEAFDYYQQALDVYENLSNCKEEKGLTCIRLAYCYENKQDQNIEKAEKYYEKGFKIIEKIRDPGLLEEALAGIIDFYARHNNSKKRQFYEDKFVKLQNAM